MAPGGGAGDDTSKPGGRADEASGGIRSDASRAVPAPGGRPYDEASAAATWYGDAGISAEIEAAQRALGVLADATIFWDAEQAVLGVAMIRPAVIADMADVLAPHHFAARAHGLIWRTILAITAEGGDPNPVTLLDKLDPAALKDMPGGGRAYLASLAGMIVTHGHAASYAETVVQCWRRREMLAAVAEAAGGLAGPDCRGAAAGLIARLDDAASAARVDTARTGVEAAEDLVRHVYAVARGEAPPPVSTGISSLDQVLGGGLYESDLVVGGGRPSMGKTTLAECIAEHVARNQQTVGFYSLEMSRRQLTAKRFQRRTGIEAARQLGGPITETEARDVAAAIGDCSLPHLVVDDASGLTPGDVLRRARRLQRTQGLALVVVDQLDLMRADGAVNGDMERRSAIVEGMQAVGKALGVPVLLLCQLNRALLSRADRRPGLGDFRGSGRIEEAARVVFGIHREDYYLERSQPDGGDAEWQAWEAKMSKWRDRAEVIVLKNHLGSAGSVVLRYDKQFQRFSDL